MHEENIEGLSSRYYIRSNKESGNGRIDLTLKPKISSMPGIIMEFKTIKDASGFAFVRH